MRLEKLSKRSVSLRLILLVLIFMFKIHQIKFFTFKLDLIMQSQLLSAYTAIKVGNFRRILTHIILIR